jgi:hypothetical protein
MPAWPASLPQYVLQQGYNEQLSDNLVETQMDAGPGKTRRRFTATVKQFGVTLEMDATQAATFEAFYETTLKQGSIPFDWVHPRTRAALTFKFKKPAPRVSVRGGGGVVQYSFMLETLP